ncbi:MAG: hypothetical protein ACI9FR_002086 [Cryomorphaceae bacterium]|jgi:hypothetical protein
MKIFTNTLLAASIVVVSSANAADIKTAGQALTLCKAQAEQAHPGYRRATSKKIRQNRAGFKLNLKVLTEEGSISTVCEVAKDGVVTYSKI